MNKLIYNVGDLILAHKKSGVDFPQYEWCTEFSFPVEYAMITKIQYVTPTKNVYWVKFINGSEDCLDLSEFKLIAKVRKNSREVAAAPLERN